MMQSEQEGQRNLQQSGTAEYTTCNEHKKAEHAPEKSKKNAKNQKNICGSNNSAGSFCRGQNIICARLLKSLECKIRDNTYGRGVSGKPCTTLREK